MSSILSRIRQSVLNTLQLSPDDLPVVDYLVSLVGANYLKDVDDIGWGWIIGPPGSCKTEMVRLLKPWDVIVTFVSSLTSNALASGTVDQEGNDPSLIPQLCNKILVLKDASPVLSVEDKQFMKLMSELRDAYDGFYAKHSGTEGRREYESKFGFIACITGVVDEYSGTNQQLGERMLAIRVSRKRGTLVQRTGHNTHVLKSSYTKKAWRKMLAELVVSAMEDYLRRLGEVEPKDIKMSDAFMERLATLADLMVSLRTAPYRSGSVSNAEIGSRLTLQLAHLGTARIIADERDEWTEEDFQFILRVAQDTLPRHVIQAALVMYRRDANRPLNAEELSKYARLPGDCVYALIPQWLGLGILEYAGQTFTHVMLTQEVREQIDLTGIFANRLPIE